MINELIEGIGQRLGLTLALDSGGSCRLIFEDKFTVDIEAPVEDGTVFYFHSILGMIDPERAEPQLANLLDANLFGQGTGDAIFALDPVLDEIVLRQSFDARFETVDHLMVALEEFVNLVANWTERLEKQAGASGDAPSEEERAPGPGRSLKTG